MTSRLSAQQLRVLTLLASKPAHPTAWAALRKECGARWPQTMASLERAGLAAPVVLHRVYDNGESWSKLGFTITRDGSDALDG